MHAAVIVVRLKTNCDTYNKIMYKVGLFLFYTEVIAKYRYNQTHMCSTPLYNPMEKADFLYLEFEP